jgi:hypothetical protein
MKKILLVIVTLSLSLFGLTSCGPFRDCKNEYQYIGKLIVPINIDKKDIKICFRDVGIIVRHLENDFNFYDTAIIDNQGKYIITGNFTGSCKSIKGILKDSFITTYQVLLNESIIQTGSFTFDKFDIKYPEKLKIMITVPDIIVK